MEKQWVKGVDVETHENRLRVFAVIAGTESNEVRAELPQREISAFLPRDILLGEEMSISPGVIPVIEETLCRLLTGRCARVWDYNERRYFGFPSWRSVKTMDDDSAAPRMDEDSEGG